MTLHPISWLETVDVLVADLLIVAALPALRDADREGYLMESSILRE
jgi:hypothetical protein